MASTTKTAPILNTGSKKRLELSLKNGKTTNGRNSTQKGHGVVTAKKQRTTVVKQSIIGKQGGKAYTPMDDSNTTAVVSIEGTSD